MYFRIISILYFLLVFHGYADSRTGRALIIAIGKYPAESGWELIHGDNDGLLIYQLLHENNYQHIKMLRNKEATKEAIYQALEKLYNETEKEDHVFIHFSCHGQQMMDLSEDEDDGLDESLIPYDALFWYLPDIYEGENHISDDEMGIWINKLRQKAGETGQVIVTLDACHSGTANRYSADYYIRGTTQIFAPEGYIPSPGKHMERSLKLKPLRGYAPVMVLSACLPDEVNFEYYCRKEKRHYGRLTYSLVSLKNKNIDILTASDWYHKIQEQMQQLSIGILPISQHPYMECSNSDVQFTLSVIH